MSHVEKNVSRSVLKRKHIGQLRRSVNAVHGGLVSLDEIEIEMQVSV